MDHLIKVFLDGTKTDALLGKYFFDDSIVFL